MNRHPDRQTLDRASVGDLPATAAGAVEEHLVACVDCLGYLAALERDRMDRLAAVPQERFLASLTSRRAAELGRQRQRRARVGGLAGLGGLVAAVAATVMLRTAPDPHSIRDMQYKNGVAPGVIVHRKRGDTVKVIGVEERIRAGDGLRLELSLPRRARVSARLEDRAGRLELAGDAGGLVLGPGTHALPESAVVSAPCVDLMLVIEIEGAVMRRNLRCE